MGQNKLKDYLLLEGDVEEIEERYSNFFEVVGILFDSLEFDVISDDTHEMLDDLIDKVIDIILSLGDEEFDKDTNRAFMKVVTMLDLDQEISEGLTVKSRKVNSGRKRSSASKITGAEKLKYLKRLKKNRKKYKKSASLRRQTKRQQKKYKKTAGAKRAKQKYNTFNKK